MERLSVEHGIRAMQSAGFSVKLAKRDPSALPVEILPGVKAGFEQLIPVTADGLCSALQNLSAAIPHQKDDRKYLNREGGGVALG